MELFTNLIVKSSILYTFVSFLDPTLSYIVDPDQDLTFQNTLYILKKLLNLDINIFLNFFSYIFFKSPFFTLIKQRFDDCSKENLYTQVYDIFCRCGPAYFLDPAI